MISSEFTASNDQKFSVRKPEKLDVNIEDKITEPYVKEICKRIIEEILQKSNKAKISVLVANRQAT